MISFVLPSYEPVERKTCTIIGTKFEYAEITIFVHLTVRASFIDLQIVKHEDCRPFTVDLLERVRLPEFILLTIGQRDFNILDGHGY